MVSTEIDIEGCSHCFHTRYAIIEARSLVSGRIRRFRMHGAAEVQFAPPPRCVQFAYRRGAAEYVFIDPSTFDEVTANVGPGAAPSMHEGEVVNAIVVGDRVLGFVSR